jgi:membrane-associated phospholipid phosphatase
MAHSRSRRVFITAPLIFGADALVPSCRRRSAERMDLVAIGWRPILGYRPDPGGRAANPGDLYHLPAPPAVDSTAGREEIDELQRREAARTAAVVQGGRFWLRGASVRWNEIARDLVARNRSDLLAASRIYALVSVAQHDACVGVYRNKHRYRRPPPHLQSRALKPLAEVAGSDEPGYPCLHAAIAAASAAVLGQLFPDNRRWLESRASEHGESRITLGASRRSDVEAGATLGRRIGAAVVQHRKEDGSERAGSADDEDLPGGWTPLANRPPVGPGWARVQPWVMPAVTRFRAPPPPAPGSSEFKAALAEVRRVSESRSQEQSRIAALWADGAGSYTPAGRWNKIAADLITRHAVSEARAARCFALLNMALMDAGIACWDTKFHYGLLRPSQADPGIRAPVGLPNFPSYTSAHACFSGAGAGLLAHLFPPERAYLDAKAEEAAVSRIYGGIHYRFDADTGLAQGRKIAALVLKERGQHGDGDGQST